MPETNPLNLWPGVLALTASGILADLLFAHVLGWAWSLLALGAAVVGVLAFTDNTTARQVQQ